MRYATNNVTMIGKDMQYKGYLIKPAIEEVSEGGYTDTFVWEKDAVWESTSLKDAGGLIFPSREEAELAALHRAKMLIDAGQVPF
jgi:hypothetical protein